ncbi:hypothetical protein GCK32_003645 [Trichostrongylus colubriformis]|uniref:Uncharacterized protein n=1 Tax=Trichostrongylus colubriformis TaxID=6319 RepID=A0AAN8F3H4_TRICO
MCLRKKTGNSKLNHPAFAPQTAGGVEINPMAAGGAGLNDPNAVGKDSKEKVKSDQGKQIFGGALVSGDFVRKRRDDDTLKEVGNVMPEYDCDKDDPQAKPVDRTQEVSPPKQNPSARLANTQYS